ncbi:related to E.coli dioxygenase [Phialocephala subalpina]|uniref:Related to E.coli dioxygenase n=1 Tax=Phialocephala subalpina TaxID=576137 RepID=A0A1L7X6M8_9HELO|nr:related to E.coli dioxygenase [Phialocephala subalpina]
MAPSATPAAADSTKPSIAQARPIPGPKSFNKELELNGNDKYPAAKAPSFPLLTASSANEFNPAFPNLLSPRVKVEELTPSIRSKISGLQLSELKDGPAKDMLSNGRPTSAVLTPTSHQALPKMHQKSTSCIVGLEIFLQSASCRPTTRRLTGTAIHHLKSNLREHAMEVPKSGGDTLFVDQVQAYENLSEGFKERLHGLRAVHSRKEQGQMSLGRGGVVKRDPVTTDHPIVRTHPATGEKALFVNRSFTRSIVGYKKEEYDNLLNFLYDHIAFGADFRHESGGNLARSYSGTAVADKKQNRLVAHTATMNWNTGERRHLARIALQTEKPYETPYEKSG